MPLPADGTKVKLGKGSLLLDALTSLGAHTGFDFMGNVSALTLAAEVTKAQLFSSTQRSAPLIAEAVTRIAYTLTATCNEYTLSNLKKFLLGESNAKTQLVGSNQTATFSGAQVVPGRYLDVGARQITGVVVTRDTTDIMVVDTDYIVYAEFGLVKIVEGGGILAGDDVEIEFDQPALTIDQVRIAKDSAPICHLLFLADDANQDADGSRDRLEIWRVAISPEGELGMISDEYGSFQITMSVLSDAANHPNDPFGTLDRVRA
jgi:hypothetical protein